MEEIAIWFGGPFDGAEEIVESGARQYAVAWDADKKRVEPWAGLQNFIADPNYVDQTAISRKVSRVHIYEVQRSQGKARIMYRERPPHPAYFSR